MEKLIPVINRLQDVFNTVGRESIQLPQIAVVGTQSTGKSSVLENIVGRDFLPRGQGVVTRRPLVLQLVHIEAEQLPSRESWGWGQFLHNDEEKLEDFTDIRRVIADETNKRAGTNKGISPDPIRLRIFSPHVLNLTLIDLPGITRVPVGDQPDDIEALIRGMVLDYIKNPKCIILAVHAANTDIATSEALKLAREVDPMGTRTLAVCTKLDLMDAGTDATDLLRGKIIPVKLGIIGVVNRSQQDIIDDKKIEDALSDEKQFLQKRYPSIVSQNGSKYLSQKLNKLLMQHIRECLPRLRHDISSKLSIYESQLQSLGEPVENKGPALLHTLTKFSSSYCQKIEGNSRDIDTNQISGGARICYIFHTTFANALSSIQPMEGLKDSDILHAINNAMGPRPALFVSEVAFELLVKKQIRLLLNPSLQCVELVYEELQRIIQYCLGHIKEFQRFPTLRDRMNQVVLRLLRQRLPITNQMVESLITIELAYINTNHPDFVGGTRAAYESYMVAKTSQARRILASGGQLNRLGVGVGVGVASSSQPDMHRQQPPPLSSGAVGTGKEAAPGGGGGGGGGASSTAKGQQQAEEGSKQTTWLQTFWTTKKVPSGSTSAMEGSRSTPSIAGPGAGNYSADGLNSIASETLGAPGGEMVLVGGDGFSTPLPPAPPPGGDDPLPQGDSISRQRFDCQLIEKLISSYFLIVRKSVQDSVPKAVMHYMVNHVQERLQSELVEELYKAEAYDQLMEESGETTTRRRDYVKMVDALQKASDILSEIRDMQFETDIVGYTEYDSM